MTIYFIDYALDFGVCIVIVMKWRYGLEIWIKFGAMRKCAS